MSRPLRQRVVGSNKKLENVNSIPFEEFLFIKAGF